MQSATCVNPIKDPIGSFEGILEFIGEFSRHAALSVRMFGNCFAGEILLIIITVPTSYISAFGSAILYGLRGYSLVLFRRTYSLSSPLFSPAWQLKPWQSRFGPLCYI